MNDSEDDGVLAPINCTAGQSVHVRLRLIITIQMIDPHWYCIVPGYVAQW